MSGLRAFFQHRIALVALMLVATLGVRALVPAGYMAGSSAHGMTIELCSGVAGKSVTLAIPGAPKNQHDGKADIGSPCAFSALGLSVDSAIDPFLLAVAIAFVMAIGLRLALTPPPARRVQISPPLRGPPSIA